MGIVSLNFCLFRKTLYVELRNSYKWSIVVKFGKALVVSIRPHPQVPRNSADLFDKNSCSDNKIVVGMRASGNL